MSALLLTVAALGLVLGAALMAWPVPAPKPVSPEPVEGRFDDTDNRASTGSVRTDAATSPAAYRRRILGAMIVGASLFLGGFTLAARNPIS